MRGVNIATSTQDYHYLIKIYRGEAGAIQAFGKLLNINPDNRGAKDNLKDILT